MNSAELKCKAKEFGADLVGIAPATAPALAGLLRSAPRTKSVIVVGHRILRGAMRGIEEGTNYSSTYGDYGKQWSEDRFLARTVYQLTCALEEEGAEAIPMLIPHDPEQGNVSFDWRLAAEAAGLGSVGKGGFFLTGRYGHRQRFALILCDFSFPPDAPVKLSLCDNCDACAAKCPLHAIDTEKKVKLGDHEIFARDEALCTKCRNGAFALGGGVNSGGSAWGWVGRQDLVCSDNADYVDRYAAACGRACLVATEKRIGEQFENNFRKRAEWSADLDGVYTVAEGEK